ncbi:MAG: hypothetical protein R3Y53_02385 [Bacillota bacterium]
MNKNNGVFGNSIDINVNPCNDAVEIRADVQVKELSTTTKRLWGQIVNSEGYPVADTLIKLVKVVRSAYEMEYIGIAHTITDCEGFYQFEICADEESNYKIIVNKAVVGDEMVIETGGGNCPNGGYDPCQMPNRYYVEHEKRPCPPPHPQPQPCPPNHRPHPAPNCNCGQPQCYGSAYSHNSQCKDPCNTKRNYAVYTR